MEDGVQAHDSVKPRRWTLPDGHVGLNDLRIGYKGTSPFDLNLGNVDASDSESCIGEQLRRRNACTATKIEDPCSRIQQAAKLLYPRRVGCLTVPFVGSRHLIITMVVMGDQVITPTDEVPTSDPLVV